VKGRDNLYTFCEQKGVGYRQCGKLVVGTSNVQLRELRNIQRVALDNGVSLSLMSRGEVLEMEPQLCCMGAVYSPMTGIVDSHEFMLALLGDAQLFGAIVTFNTRVTRITPVSDGFLVGVNGGDPQVKASRVVNSAGLHAVDVARSIDMYPAGLIPSVQFNKGCYFSFRGKCPFSHLIYPIPTCGGLGIHLTFDLAGRARFGPDAQWINKFNYDVDLSRVDTFYQSIREYWPLLPDDSLMPAYAGIRPRITDAGGVPADFRIDGPGVHGIRGLVNMFGIESPGLTASLAIGDYVADLVLF